MRIKRCSKCKTEKPLEAFSIRKDTNKPRSECKICHSTDTVTRYWRDPEKFRRQAQERRDKNPEKAAKFDRTHHLKTLYNITPEQYEAMVIGQENRCAICGGERVGPGKFWHVDHNPKNNVVRGLLCSRCNTGIGLFKDNINSLSAAILYLQSDGVLPD